MSDREVANVCFVFDVDVVHCLEYRQFGLDSKASLVQRKYRRHGYI